MLGGDDTPVQKVLSLAISWGSPKKEGSKYRQFTARSCYRWTRDDGERRQRESTEKLAAAAAPCWNKWDGELSAQHVGICPGTPPVSPPEPGYVRAFSSPVQGRGEGHGVWKAPGDARRMTGWTALEA